MNVLSFAALTLASFLVVAAVVSTFWHPYDYTRRIFRESFEEVPVALSDIKNLKGNIVSVEIDSSNTPTWILSGKWKISESSANSSNYNTSNLKLSANITMIGSNGLGEHRHRITDFKLTNLTFSNKSAIIRGDAAMISSGKGSMGLESVIKDIPITAKIDNLRAISIDIDQQMVKQRFGKLPVFGTVS